MAAAQRLVLWSELVLARLLRTKVGTPAVGTTGGMVIVTITAAVADGTASRIGTVGNLGDLIRIKAPLAVLPRGPEPGMLMGSLPRRGCDHSHAADFHMSYWASILLTSTPRAERPIDFLSRGTRSHTEWEGKRVSK